VADRVIFMEDGQIMEEGTPEHFFEHPDNPRCRSFLAKILH
jgi:putative glutamine transport system ATP-binding protein